MHSSTKPLQPSRSHIALKHILLVMLPNAFRALLDHALSYLGKLAPCTRLATQHSTPHTTQASII
jgi:hypothetical protein